ncbi:major facilitator superfamily domain-containing protein [Infundibulicybe gibba]|nr:major facilitator superfamily domain-containing protein [Infundibulicybe gibba]
MAQGHDTETLHRRFNTVWRTSLTQILLISIICFCCPGMYNAISGLGGSGQLDSTVAANATVALLAATAASALTLVPPIFDLFGPRVCLLLGKHLAGVVLSLYSGSLLCYNHSHNSAFVIASGAILGVGASFLWVAQGAIMVSYPLPDQRGRAIALFWVIFNLGGAIGSFISFALNFNSKNGHGAFIAIMSGVVVGWLLCILVPEPHTVLRPDGSLAGPPPLSSHKTSDSKSGISMTNWRILFLIPAFFCANFFYSYQQNSVNGATFTLRTRSLNGAMYWFAQMFGGLLIGFLLDLKYLSRPQRAILGYVVVFVTGFAIWGGGLAFQRWENSTGKHQWLDLSNQKHTLGRSGCTYFFYGSFDAFWQSYCYWLMASLADSPQMAAKFVGLYKTFQATGGAVAWRINALGFSPLRQLTINWALLGGALLFAIPTVLSITPSPDSSPREDSGNEWRGRRKDSKILTQ